MMFLSMLTKKDGVYDDITAQHRRPSIQRSKAFASNLHLAPIKTIATTMYMSLMSNTSLDNRFSDERDSYSPPVISTDSILEFFFPLLLMMKKSTNTIHSNNDTMKRVESSSTMSTMNSSIGEVGIIDDDTVVKYSYRVIKRVLSTASFCSPHDMSNNSRSGSSSNSSSEQSLQPSLKKRAKITATSTFSPATKKKSFPNDVPGYVGGTSNAVELSPLSHEDTAEALRNSENDGEDYGWFIDAEDFNLYGHYFK